MAETFPQRVERMEHQEALPSPEHQKALAEHAERAKAEKDPSVALQEAHGEVQEALRSDTQTSPLERLQASETAAAPQTSQFINRDLKSITLKRELKHVQRKLSAPERGLSHVVHQPIVRAVSETTGKTLSRPSGLLGGGLVALLGTSSYLYMAKHYGFTYNSTIFLLLFAGGFALGLIIELFVHLATRSRHSDA